MSLGENIRKYRERVSISQAELGKKLGVSSQAVSKWETNKAEPDSAALKAMCGIFNITADELLSISGRDMAKEDINGDDIKFAVFGDPDVTDAQFEEIKKIARIIRERDKK